MILVLTIIQGPAADEEECSLAFGCASQHSKCLNSDGLGLFKCVPRCEIEKPVTFDELSAAGIIAHDCYCQESAASGDPAETAYCKQGGKCLDDRDLDTTSAELSIYAKRGLTYCLPRCEQNAYVEFADCWCQKAASNAASSAVSKICPPHYLCDPSSKYSEGIVMDFCDYYYDEINVHRIGQTCGCGNQACKIDPGNNVCYSPDKAAHSNPLELTGQMVGSACIRACPVNQPVAGATCFCPGADICTAGNTCARQAFKNRCVCGQNGYGPCYVSSSLSCAVGQQYDGSRCKDAPDTCSGTEDFQLGAAYSCQCGATKNCLIFQGQSCVEGQCIRNCPAGVSNYLCACRADGGKATITYPGFRCYPDGAISCVLNQTASMTCKCGPENCISGQICLGGLTCISYCTNREAYKGCLCNLGATLQDELCENVDETDKRYCVNMVIQDSQYRPQVGSTCIRACNPGLATDACKCTLDALDQPCAKNFYCAGGFPAASESTKCLLPCESNPLASEECVCSTDYTSEHSVCKTGEHCVQMKLLDSEYVPSAAAMCVEECVDGPVTLAQQKCKYSLDPIDPPCHYGFYVINSLTTSAECVKICDQFTPNSGEECICGTNLIKCEHNEYCANMLLDGIYFPTSTSSCEPICEETGELDGKCKCAPSPTAAPCEPGEYCAGGEANTDGARCVALCTGDSVDCLCSSNLQSKESICLSPTHCTGLADNLISSTAQCVPDCEPGINVLDCKCSESVSVKFCASGSACVDREQESSQCIPMCEHNVKISEKCICDQSSLEICEANNFCRADSQSKQGPLKCIPACEPNEVITKECICGTIDNECNEEEYCRINGDAHVCMNQCPDNSLLTHPCRCFNDKDEMCESGYYCLNPMEGNASCIPACEPDSLSNVPCLCDESTNLECEENEYCQQDDFPQDAQRMCIDECMESVSLTQECICGQPAMRCQANEYCYKSLSYSCVGKCQEYEVNKKECYCQIASEFCAANEYCGRESCAFPTCFDNSCKENEYCDGTLCQPCNKILPDCIKCTATSCLEFGDSTITEEKCQSPYYYEDSVCKLCPSNMIQLYNNCIDSACESDDDCPFAKKYFCKNAKCTPCKYFGVEYCSECDYGACYKVNRGAEQIVAKNDCEAPYFFHLGATPKCAACDESEIEIDGACIKTNCKMDSDCGEELICHNSFCRKCDALMPSCTKCNQSTCFEVGDTTITSSECVKPLYYYQNACHLCGKSYKWKDSKCSLQNNVILFIAAGIVGGILIVVVVAIMLCIASKRRRQKGLPAQEMQYQSEKELQPLETAEGNELLGRKLDEFTSSHYLVEQYSNSENETPVVAADELILFSNRSIPTIHSQVTRSLSTLIQ